jgi:hypothetical protein
MDSRKGFEKWAWSENGAEDFSRESGDDYTDEMLENMWTAWKASRQALECEPIRGYSYELASCTNEYGEYCNWSLGISHQKPSVPPDAIRNLETLYTHPASAVPDAEYIRALQDAFDIIQSDANTKENYRSMCQIGSVLRKLKAKQEQGQ